MLESYLSGRRGYVFRMPKAQSPVVLMLSGGMDSAIAWHTLIHTHRLMPYPLVVGRGWWDPQVRAVHAISSEVRQRFPEAWRPPHIVCTKDALRSVYPSRDPRRMDPQEILEQYSTANDLLSNPRLWGGSMWHVYTAYMYAQKLRYDSRLPVDTVFTGVTADDGRFVPTQTVAFLRLMMVALMQIAQSDEFQFGSPFLEPSLRISHTKVAVTRMGIRLGVPLAHTYSCDRKWPYHCGTCLSCQSRMFCFSENGVADPTWYVGKNPLRFLAKTMVKKAVKAGYRAWRSLPGRGEEGVHR